MSKDIFSIIEEQGNILNNLFDEKDSQEEALKKAIRDLDNKKRERIDEIDCIFLRKEKTIKEIHEPSIYKTEESIKELRQSHKQMQKDLLAAQCILNGDSSRKIHWVDEKTCEDTIDTIVDKAFILVKAVVVKGKKPTNKYELHIMPIAGRYKGLEEEGISTYRSFIKAMPTRDEIVKYYERNKEKLTKKILQIVEASEKRAKDLINEFGEDSIKDFDFRLAFKEKWSGEDIIKAEKNKIMISLSRVEGDYFSDSIHVELKHLKDNQFEADFLGRKLKKKTTEGVLKHLVHRISCAPLCWIDNPNIKG